MNLISLSLWGHDERYIQGAIRNAELAPDIYPGWTVRVYCSSEVPVLDQLRSLGVDVRIVPAAPDHAGLFWRFLPACFSRGIIRCSRSWQQPSLWSGLPSAPASAASG